MTNLLFVFFIRFSLCSHIGHCPLVPFIHLSCVSPIRNSPPRRVQVDPMAHSLVPFGPWPWCFVIVRVVVVFSPSPPLPPFQTCKLSRPGGVDLLHPC